MALAEHTKIGFYHSQNLREWTYAGGFVKEGLGVLECPDLFRITAEDDAGRITLSSGTTGLRGTLATPAVCCHDLVGSGGDGSRCGRSTECA